MCTTAPIATPATRPGGVSGAGLWLLVWLVYCGSAVAQTGDAGVRDRFRVKYVAEGAVYLEGGRAAGLAEGQRLTLRRGENSDAQVIAELQVFSVASASAVCEVMSSNGPVQPGDMAYLSADDAQRLRLLKESQESRKYPQIVSFTDGDPLDEEARENVPRPPLPEINRARGRFGFEYGSIRDRETPGSGSSQLGVAVRTDMTRLGGTYWNFSGYYRNRFTSRSRAQQETLTDLINRTYHLSLSYNNPGSSWVAGFGRLYLPWASSLNTIDGGYVGRRHGKHTVFGLFGGSTPDPTSWNYTPNRQMAGSFVNFEAGRFESFRYTSTTGIALARVHWHPDRQFGFFENGLFYKGYFSLYHNLEADLLRGTPEAPASGLVASRSYLTIRVQPNRIVAFDLSHNYFRNIPTFDERLVGTGLLDKLLFQGVSGGARLELPYSISPYFNLGRSDRTGDARTAWNRMFGVVLRRVWRTGIRADMRYSSFDSSFGRGTYRSLSLSRELGERVRFDVQAGDQDFVSSMTRNSRARWLNADADWFLGPHYFLGAGVTFYRGRAQSYDQWFLNLGYRF